MRARKATVGRGPRRSNAEPGSGNAASIADLRPEAAAQSRQAAAIRTSPMVVAQRKHVGGIFGAPLQRQSIEDEELLQGKVGALQRREQDGGSPANDTGLPDHIKSGIEALGGVSLDDVRVHRNSAQPAQVAALAYTRGRDIHLAPGQERHLAHEAWHVVQQAQGRVPRTTTLGDGVPANTDRALEREADVMGARAQRL